VALNFYTSDNINVILCQPSCQFLIIRDNLFSSKKSGHKTIQFENKFDLIFNDHHIYGHLVSMA
jgi:hypothetical protein